EVCPSIRSGAAFPPGLPPRAAPPPLSPSMGGKRAEGAVYEGAEAPARAASAEREGAARSSASSDRRHARASTGSRETRAGANVAGDARARDGRHARETPEPVREGRRPRPPPLGLPTRLPNPPAP